ncbi:hypothetical protein CDL12_23145 [Handroanthus impetiginosus]|uniref:DUF4005 domain-containing protein n=1 Tax=Handroanthus impetiginosus TaxID=429701 RepID=A0A2G9GGK4_9LAMI|nr:hypothetical protein CDL12_23145 [Handroanthus impetiginosus]
MGKSTASCFKIIACGSDSVDNDDLQTVEINAPSDERGWSFRKRSSRHRVLNNTVISEAPLPLNKQNPEPAAADFQVKPNLTVPEKTSVNQCMEEKTDLSDLMDSELPDSTVTREDDCRAGTTLDESSIIIIQTAIRGYMARRVLLKQKNIIKLQAAVRGHLVRMHAVGTLRCVQAIFKVQALVRARCARALAENDVNLTLVSSKREARLNGSFTHTSTEKLLSNKFARQLMESTRRTKPINIKCDPLKSDSAWKWLERWMSVSLENKEAQESGPAAERHEKENLGHHDGKGDIFPSDFYQDLKSTGVSSETSEHDDNLITYDAENLDLRLRNIDESDSRYDVKESDKEETENEKFPSEPETDAKKLSRKASNPAFIAAQSKFEELSSAATSAKLTILSNVSLGVESSPDMLSPFANQPVRFREIGLKATSISNASAVQIAGSECGTELSISSTLDSPDGSEAGASELEPKVSDATDHPRSREHLGLEANESPLLEKKPGRSHKESPRSHTIVQTSQATPSSQVSVEPKKRSESSGKSRSTSADKRSLSTPNHDSASRTSLEQSQKEHKTGKSRSFFGSAKPDHTCQEPGGSSSSISLPSYMQATESAKAKAIANGSPRSSPDVQDKDIYIKNRHPLPGINGHQGSPRVHRPLSQAKQNAKGNGIHSPQERKWKR